jgi:TonB family protein
MCCKNFWLRIVPFLLALIFSLITVTIFQKVNFEDKSEKNIKPLVKLVSSGGGTGFSGGSKTSPNANTQDKALGYISPETMPVKIISKPRANYTDAARQNQLQGTVTLRVTFLASGEIGAVSSIEDLPDGLTEQAILAARGIKFEPAKINDIPQTVTKQVQYSFTIY